MSHNMTEKYARRVLKEAKKALDKFWEQRDAVSGGDTMIEIEVWKLEVYQHKLIDLSNVLLNQKALTKFYTDEDLEL